MAAGNTAGGTPKKDTPEVAITVSQLWLIKALIGVIVSLCGTLIGVAYFAHDSLKAGQKDLDAKIDALNKNVVALDTELRLVVKPELKTLGDRLDAKLTETQKRIDDRFDRLDDRMRKK